MNITDAREIIAQRASKELLDGQVVNLGVGIPTFMVKYISKEIEVIYHTENGLVGFGPPNGLKDPDLIDASCNFVGLLPYSSMVDSLMSFGIMRGGHLDLTCLGAYQIDQEGNIASWSVPGQKISGMGGAMDLVVGAKRVIVTITHTDFEGKPKIMKKCTLPLTAQKVVDRVITELGVFDCIQGEGFVLTEIAPEVTVEEIIAKTQARIIVPDNIKIMQL